MQAPLEIEIDLTAQELQSLPALDGLVQADDMVEVDDISSIDPLLHTTDGAANLDCDMSDESIEIELTAEQMDEMLR